jgi:hypothetical protein
VRAILRIIAAPLLMIAAGLIVLIVWDVTEGAIMLALGIALGIARWVEWYFYPRFRFRVWPRMRP